MINSLFAMKGKVAAVSTSRICTEWHRLCTSPLPAWPGGPSGEATRWAWLLGDRVPVSVCRSEFPSLRRCFFRKDCSFLLSSLALFTPYTPIHI